MRAGCTRALESLGDPRALAALQPHLETCADCRALVEAHARLRDLPAPPLDASAARRIRDIGRAELAARPRAPAWWVGALVLGGVALGVGAAGAVFMPRGAPRGFNPHRLLGWTLAGPALARGGGRRGARQCRRGRRGRLRALSGLVRRILGSGPSLCARGRPLLVACVRSGATLPAERRVLAAARARRWASDRRRRGASVAPALPDRRGEPPRALPRASLVCGGGGGAPHPAPPLPAKLRPLASLLRDQLAAMPSMFAPSGTATV